MKATAIIFAALAAITANAATEVFRLERDTDTGALAVVGVDNVRRAVQLIDPDEYAMMTGHVAAVWRALNSTDDGRRKLHGNREKTIVDTNAAEVVTVYADGYRWREKMPELTKPKNPRNVRPPSPENPPRKPGNISERQFKMRQAIENRRKAKPREVTVIRDATTGEETEVK